MTGEKNYQPGQLINSAALVRGAVDMPWLELPEIKTADGKPAIVFMKPLTVHEVFSFNTDRITSEAAVEKAKAEGREVDDLTLQKPLHKMISQSVVDKDGKQLLRPEDIGLLDLRVFNRLARAVTNMIGNREPEYEAPEEPTKEVPADTPTDVKDKVTGNVSGEASRPATSSASPTV